METAGEGGPWGMAILAAYMLRDARDQSLEDYLACRVFKDAQSTTAVPDPTGVAGFASYIARYEACLDAQKAAANLQ
jgi:hypothetical protein